MDDFRGVWLTGIFRGQSGDREEDILSLDGSVPGFIPVLIDAHWFELFELHHWHRGQPVYYSCGFELRNPMGRL